MADSNKHTPSLRFPEFNSAPGWIILPIGEVADTFSGGTPYVGNSDFYGGTIPFIRSGEIACEKTAISLTEYGLSNSAAKMIKKGTLLYALYGATSGNVAISKIDGAINQAILAIIPKDDKYNNYFVYYFLEYQKPSVLSKYLQGGQGNLSAAIINSIPIAIPCNCDGTISCDEQAKVVDILLSLDSLIAATKSKLEQLKEHKRGLIQRLFPARGKTVPELRFPEFLNDGEWEMATMESIFEIKNGYTPSKSNPDYWEGGTIPWFRMEDIRKSGHILSDSIQHITPSAVKSAGLFPAYSIIVATTATIGEHALIIVDSLANQRFTFLTKRKSFDNRIDMVYFHYFMFIIDEWCKQNTNAGGLLSVNMEAFRKLVIPYPASLSEQHKIAECFSSIDKQIAATKRKFEQLKEHQKGLMQRLFPIVK